MQSHHIGCGIKGFCRVANLGYLWNMTPKDTQERIKIVRFFEKHGLQAAQDGYGLSRRTLYRWRAKLKVQPDNPRALAAKSPAPKRKRQPLTPKIIVDEIKHWRRVYPNLGKEKLHAILKPWCEAQSMICPSVSTIRIIARAPD